jgi:flagellar hook-length control protein FliK
MNKNQNALAGNDGEKIAGILSRDGKNNLETLENKMQQRFNELQPMPATDSTGQFRETLTTKLAATNPALPAQVTPGPLLEQLYQGIHFLRTGHGETAIMDLNPEELGRLKIGLKISGEKAQISFQAANEDCARMLKSQMGDLIQALGLEGLTISNLEVSVNPQLTGQNGDGQAGWNQSARDGHDERSKPGLPGIAGSSRPEDDNEQIRMMGEGLHILV